MGVHRCREAARILDGQGIASTVVDLRTTAPLDRETICAVAEKTRRVVVVDEDYEACGISGEIAAILAESGISARFGRVAATQAIPYARHREAAVLPNVGRIVETVHRLCTE